ncbi:hypothetical protein HDV64DRAFT_238345 [Trichoderma sp. TUCIM 5745]
MANMFALRLIGRGKTFDRRTDVVDDFPTGSGRRCNASSGYAIAGEGQGHHDHLFHRFPTRRVLMPPLSANGRRRAELSTVLNVQ